MNWTSGALLALAAQRHIRACPQGIAQEPFMRAVAFALFVFMPLGVFLLHVYPAWSWMYLFDPGPLHPLLRLSAALAYPIFCVGGHLLAQRCIQAQREGLAWAAVAVGAAGVLAVTVLSWDRLLVVGGYAEWKLGVARQAWHHGPWMWDMLLVVFAFCVGFALVGVANLRSRPSGA